MNNTTCPMCEGPFAEEGERLVLCEDCRRQIDEEGDVPPAPSRPLTPVQIAAGNKIFEECLGGANG